MKVILKGTTTCQWNLGEGFRAGGTELELNDKEIKKAEADNLIECYIDTTKGHTKDRFIHDKAIEETVVAEKPTEKWTKETLTKIVEERGITGLREIGDKFGVKFRSIDEGISDILGAQK